MQPIRLYLTNVCVFVLRDHLLQEWFPLISICPVTVQMYEQASFLRDKDMIQFLCGVLRALIEFTIVLESSLLKDISWNEPSDIFNTEKWMRVLDFTRSGVLYLGSFSRYHRVYFPGTFFGCHREHSPRVFSRGSFAGQSWGASLRGRLSTCMTSCIAVYLFSIPAAFVLKMICFGFAAHTEEYVQNSYLNYWKSYHIIM